MWEMLFGGEPASCSWGMRLVWRILELPVALKPFQPGEESSLLTSTALLGRTHSLKALK